MTDEAYNPEWGPHLNAAFFCEKVLRETDGVTSAIRMVDRITFQQTAQDPKAPMSPTPYLLDFCLSIRTGEQPGPTEVRVELLKPDNTTTVTILQQTINLESPGNRGATIAVRLRIMFDQVGVYWGRVYIKEKLRTRIPLEIIWLPQKA